MNWLKTLTFVHLMLFVFNHETSDVWLDLSSSNHQMPKVYFKYHDSCYYFEYISLKECGYSTVNYCLDKK